MKIHTTTMLVLVLFSIISCKDSKSVSKDDLNKLLQEERENARQEAREEQQLALAEIEERRRNEERAFRIKREKELELEKLKIQAEAKARIEDRRKKQEDRDRRKALAKKFSQQAGEQLMEAIGGGQDLVVEMKSWEYNSYSQQLEMKLSVRFNGSFIQSNTYAVDGKFLVQEDGTKAKFSRTWANTRYKEKESDRMWLKAGIGGALLLNEMSKEE